jgi:hypothetical protein
MPLHKDLREFVESLNSAGVDYLIVGAFAVAWHGYPRYTADIDFIVRPEIDNADALFDRTCPNRSTGGEAESH